MRRKLALALLCAPVAAGALQAPAAQAAQVCTFTEALMGSINPMIGLAGVSDGVFDFQGKGDCVVDTRLLPDTDLDSSGRFDTVVCTVGTFTGTMTAGLRTFRYRVTLAGTTGDIDILPPDVGDGTIELRPLYGDCLSGIHELVANGWFWLA